MAAAATVSIMNTGNYAVGWMTLTFINSALAQSKNRSGIVWWVVSLFIGPLATAIIAIVPAETARSNA
jgi:hypothetical protein